MTKVLQYSWQIVLLMSLVTTVQADSPAMWLAKMQKAIQTTSYLGTYVYISNGQIETMRVFHKADEQGERERLISISGQQREIIKDDNQVMCILPTERAVVIGPFQAVHQLSAIVQKNITQLKRLYDIQIVGHDRIAGHPTTVLAILPKDKMRYGYTVWLDKETAMVLRSDTYSAQGEVMAQMVFTEFVAQALAPPMLEPEVIYRDFQKIVLNSDQAVVANHNPWRFDKPLMGFKVMQSMHKKIPAKQQMVHHVILSDGIASVSVYIEKINDQDLFIGASKTGGIHAYGRRIAGHQITVMGEAPPATVQHIANAIVYQQ